jgi:hypothetical protein
LACSMTETVTARPLRLFCQYSASTDRAHPQEVASASLFELWRVLINAQISAFGG